MMDFPISEATSVAHSGPLPDAVDVVVIGGGIIGVMTAWYLARRGQSVLVCEKGRIAAEQSSRNWGWIRQQGRDPAELPIMIEANRIWQGMEVETGADLGLRQTGICYVARDSRDMARYEAWLAHAKVHELDSRLLSQSEISALMPKADIICAGALWTASDFRAEPWVAVPAMARAASKAGVTLREACAVRALDISAGRVTGVVTEAGRVRADRVVVAGGAWSSLFLRAHGISIPQLSVRATVVATEVLPSVFDGAGVDHRLAWRRRQDGGYTLAPSGFHEMMIGPDAFRHLRTYVPHLGLGATGNRLLPAAPRGYPDAWTTPRRWTADRPGPFEAMRILNPKPNRARVARLARDFAATFPELGQVQVRASWAGMIDTMPDVVPVIDHAPLEGLTIATGMSGHGFGIGPAIGRVVADLVCGNPPGHDLTRFRLSRFSDGSRLDPGPAL